jgi:hypothetical protein
VLDVLYVSQTRRNGARWVPLKFEVIIPYHVSYVVFDRTRPWQTTTGRAELHALPAQFRRTATRELISIRYRVWQKRRAVVRVMVHTHTS